MHSAASQPDALAEECQQQQAGRELRRSEAFAGKKSAHQRSAVLTCPVALLEKRSDG